MNSDLASIRRPAGLSRRSNLRIPVVALHDGAGSASLVAQAREQMRSLLGESPSVHFYSWAFHHLEALDVRAMAGHVAEASPLILIASEDGHPPEHVERWLDQSLVEQEEERALLVALEDREGPLCAFAGRLADRWRTRHLCATQLDVDPQRQFVLGAVERRLRLEESDRVDVPDEFVDRAVTTKNSPPAISEPWVRVTEPRLREEIRMRAYHLWLNAGRPHGQELDFWLRAERDFFGNGDYATAVAPEHC